ncbi:hypothetical protein DES53_106313 [Roseimicrobium gellanilyticum]|uniref:Uncharacterized protein n=1 Tax=Roseimicrobium gellanilyticum TaxID=748857 RepID=A0A366HK36_9BACT|nr:hypothetical protein [Roseimicrobium gellanilyticum]RBP42604.1 hypothetical protein DES53_106313 [Roseimicrobium gellanilyticum]
MKKQFADYTWLAGNHGSKGSLWQGPDHLLVIEGKGFLLALSEVYRRLDYKNVQALTLTETRRYVWMSFLLGIGALLFALLTWATWNQEPFIPISLALPAGLLAILLAVHLARGRTCSCTLQTAVQVLRLKPLNRLQTALPVIQRLETLCQQHQQGMPVMTPESLAAAPAPSSMPTPMGYASAAGMKPPWSGSGWVLAAGLLSVGWAMVLAGELFVSNLLFTVLNMLVGGASFIMAIVALVRAHLQKVPVGLSGALLGGLVTHFGTGVLLAVVGVMSTAKLNKQATPLEILERNQRASEDLFNNLAACSFGEAGALGWALLGIAMVLACCGIVQLVYSPRRKGAAGATGAAVPPATPPPMV